MGHHWYKTHPPRTSEHIWVYHQLQWVKHLLPTPIQYRLKIQRLLKGKPPSPQGKTIYSRFNLNVPKHWHRRRHAHHGEVIQENKNGLPEEYPTTDIFETLNLVLRNRMSIFGETYWLKTKGTVMENKSAVWYANFVMMFHENTHWFKN